MEITDSHPFPFFSSCNGLAVENMKGQLEVSEGLHEGSDRLLDFDLHPHFFLDMVS